MKSRQAGFTFVEVCISAVFLSGILALGVDISRRALQSADRTVVADVVATRLDSALDRIRGQFVAASRGTLQAIPIGKFVPEPMQDGVVYDNVQFRRVTGVSVGAPLYAPPIGKAPLRFFCGTDHNQSALLFDNGAMAAVLIPEGATATFTKQGDQIVVTLNSPANKFHPAAALAAAFRLLVQ
jgi:hypothetical protein